MKPEEQIYSWRDYRLLKPIDDINVLLRQSIDPGWVGMRELLARKGWSNLHRVGVIMGNVLGGDAYLLLPDETVTFAVAQSGLYETCSVQEFADWDVKYAEALWYTVLWLRYHMKLTIRSTQALRESDEPAWRDIRAFVESKGFDASTGAIEETATDLHDEVWYFVSDDRRRFWFDVPYRGAQLTDWEERPPDHQRFPHGYRTYEFACWLLDAEEGKTSNWIFSTPFDWWDNIKPGWNPPFGFGKPTSSEQS